MRIRNRALLGISTVVTLALLAAGCADGSADTDADEEAAVGAEADDGEVEDADSAGENADEDTDSAGEDADEDSQMDDIDPVTFTFASFVDDQNPHMLAWQSWMEQVTERTGGAVTFESNYSGALCEAALINSCATDGVIDIGFSTPAYTPSDFPIGGISNVPFQTSNLQANGNALNALYRDTPELQAELEGQNQHLLWYAPADVSVLATTQPVEDLEDLSGRSIRAVGDVVPAFEALGINPVAVGPGEMYESLQRGVLDGAFFPLDGQAGFRHFEVAEYFYDLGQYTGSVAALQTTINLDVWESLDPAIRNVMTEVSEELASSIVDEFFAPAFRRDCELVLEEASDFSEIGPTAEGEAWAAEWGERLMQDWIEGATEAGIEGAEEIASDFLSLLREYEESDPEAARGGTVCLEMAQGD
ncbi:TRAP transporter substrate-binding protein DctP [Roseovarius sp.]|uniref:TRAP transporter substrate-binding protein DctP n=1 Tax=Roseovarius sp. TaxID=1486281 RepID=UPI00356875F6